MSLHHILQFPIVYKTAQFLLAPGMNRRVTQGLAQALAGAPTKGRLLDVGCGPSSWLWNLGLQPIGLDLSHAYTANFQAAGGCCVTASAAELPFPADSFDVVVSVALLHHLPQDLARQTVSEMVRVTRRPGAVVVFDPVLPRSGFERPLAWGLCQLDRGRFIRRQAELESQILSNGEWEIQRFTHSYLGTEGVLCKLTKY